MNIWRLDKDPSLRAALVALQTEGCLANLVFEAKTDQNPRELWLRHADHPGLSAYLYTYGQAQGHYGVQLDYPAQDPAVKAAYDPLENLSLRRLIDILQMHFTL